jgi:uncharacterized membrane protein YfcA
MTVALFILAGLAIGLISGMLGIGGGVLLVPVLMWFFHIRDQRQAQGISLAVLTMPVLLPAVWRYYSEKWISSDDLIWAVCLAVGVALGAYAGSKLLAYITVGQLRFFFGLMLIYIAIRFILVSDSEVASAAFGLTAVAIAWLAYLGLRLLGRRNLPRPDLGDTMRSVGPKAPGESDYYI